MPAIVDRPPVTPPTETQADPKRPWWRRRAPFATPQTRVAAPTDDGELLIDNQTDEAWRVHVGYRDLGAIAACRQLRVRVVKTGLLSARPVVAPPGANYLMAHLSPSVDTVQIRRTLVNGEPFFDLRLVEQRPQKPVA